MRDALQNQKNPEEKILKKLCKKYFKTKVKNYLNYIAQARRRVRP